MTKLSNVKLVSLFWNTGFFSTSYINSLHLFLFFSDYSALYCILPSLSMFFNSVLALSLIGFAFLVPVFFPFNHTHTQPTEISFHFVWQFQCQSNILSSLSFGLWRVKTFKEVKKEKHWWTQWPLYRGPSIHCCLSNVFHSFLNLAIFL